MKILAASGSSRKKRNEKGRLDTAAACLILQGYLDSHS
jgi:putative Holliday junction resolvase